MNVPSGLGDALLNGASDAAMQPIARAASFSGIPARSGSSASPPQTRPVNRST